MKTKKFIRLASVLLFMTIGLMNSNAGHITGNEITYRWIDTLTYEVNFVFYRSCAGVPMSNPTSTCKVVCQTSGSSVGLSLKLKSIEELQTFCDTISSQCSGTNKSRSGVGIEIHTYRDTVDFRTSKYRGLISSGCSDIRFEISVCCREGAITTGPASKVYYNHAYLSLKDGGQNSSPQFALPTVPKLTCNQPFYTSIGAIDTIDGDSLSYHIVKPLSGWGTPITMNWPPFTVYYPGSLTYPYSNPNANPPIGFYFDEETGRLVVTPTKCGETTVMVYEIKEWRKDSSGKYKNIGITRRDMVYSVTSRKINNPPVLTSAQSYSVCEDDSLCINFTTKDQVVVPSPPTPTPDPDTSSISWNRGIPGAQFTIVDSTALNQTGRFCWKPKSGSARSYPYQFDIKIEDNNCPNQGISYYPVEILVKQRAVAKVNVDSIGCGKYVVESEVDSNMQNPYYGWAVMNSVGKVLSQRKGPIFNTTGSFISVSKKDTIRFQKGGKYVIQHTIDNRARCLSISYDTIVVPELFEVKLAQQSDTFVCQGNALKLDANVVLGSGQLTYKWSTGDSTKSINARLPDSITIDELSVLVTDTASCIAIDVIDLINRPRPIVDQLSDIGICKGDSIRITPNGHVAWWDDPRDKDITIVRQGFDLSFTLVENGKNVTKDTSFWIKNNTDYSIIGTDSLGCEDTATFKLSYPSVNMPSNLSICADAGKLNLRLLEDPKYLGGRWSCPSDTQLVVNGYEVKTDLVNAISKSVTKAIYYTFVHKTLGCVLVDSFFITVNPLPMVELRDGYFCQSKKVVNVIDDKIIKLPGGASLTLGRQAWKCVDCGNYKESDIVNDSQGGVYGTAILHIDETAMPLGSKTADTIYVELEFRNAYGCYNRDTAAIAVTKVPKISFTGFPNLCWDEGIVELKGLSSVTPNDGIWKAIDSTGYAQASGFNIALKGDTLNGDTLNTSATPQPSEGSSFTYLMRYSHDASGCLATRDTFLTIRGLPEPQIDRTILSINTQTQPYSFCTSQSDLTLAVKYNGGVWSSSESQTMVGNVFKPSKSTKVNIPFKVYYDYSDIYGCRGSDSVQVVVESPNALAVTPKDTAHSWYADNMVQLVNANPRFGYGLKWEAPDGGSFENDTAKTTQFTFQTDKEVTSIVRVKATASQAYNACGAETNEISILVHRTPCIDFEMDLDLTSSLLKLTPEVDSLASYQWTVLDSNSFEVNPTFDVSEFTDSIVNVRLQTHNRGGDNCYTDKRINLKNGSVNLVNQNHIRIYPNPVLNGFSIEVQNETEIDVITIYNSVGSEMTLFNRKGNYFDCSSLMRGIYSVVIRIDNETYVSKFIKE